MNAAFHNGNAVRCANCGAPLMPKRGSRRQRFCGTVCKKSTARASKWAAQYRTLEAGRSVQNNRDNSKGCAGDFADRAPAKLAFPVNILGGRRWPQQIDATRRLLIRRAIAIEIGGAP
jgi:hypothetical protein